jgi:hypothetical protein
MSPAAGGAAGVVVRPEPYDGPIAGSLVAALVVDVEDRYAGDEEPDDPRPSGHWRSTT